MNISAEQLSSIMPAADPKKWIAPLNEALPKYDIDSPFRVAAFLANIAEESAELTRLVENLNYSAEGLLRVFRGRFTPALAREYARKPERIANRVYANRYGNGDEASGDGWRFRGQGPIQLTFRDNYVLLDKLSGVPIIEQPELLQQPLEGLLVAGCYWWYRGGNSHADKMNFRACIRIINPALMNSASRELFYARALRAFGVRGSK